MQNWYSQNSPARSKSVGVGRGEGIGGGVDVGMAAITDAIACWVSTAVLALGKEHAVTINTVKNKRR